MSPAPIVPLPSHQRLEEVLDYDPITGVFRWKMSRRNAPAGKVAGFITLHGYRSISIDNVQYRAARLAYAIVYGEDPPEYVDHINGDRADDRIANLRAATPAENCRNCCIPAHNKSGIKGVSLRSKSQRWVAQIRVNRRNITIGEYKTIDEAADAYREASSRYHGEFGRC